MKYFLLLIFCLITIITNGHNPDSVKVIGLHPAIRKTISQDAKIKYHLFPEYKDSLFGSAQIIKLNDTIYHLVIHSITGTDVKATISIKELDEMYFRIDDVYASAKAQEDPYALPEEDRKEIRRKENARKAGKIIMTVMTNIVLVSLQAFLSVTLSN